MKTFRRTLLAALSVAAFAASFQVAAQDFKPRIIRFGYGLNEASNQGRATKLFAEEVEKASGGKMRVRAIGAAALGSDLQMQHHNATETNSTYTVKSTFDPVEPMPWAK